MAGEMRRGSNPESLSTEGDQGGRRSCNMADILQVPGNCPVAFASGTDPPGQVAKRLRLVCLFRLE